MTLQNEQITPDGVQSHCCEIKLICKAPKSTDEVNMAEGGEREWSEKTLERSNLNWGSLRYQEDLPRPTDHGSASLSLSESLQINRGCQS